MSQDDQKLLPAPDKPLLLPAASSGSSRSGRHSMVFITLAFALCVLIAFALGWFVHHRRDEAAQSANKAQRDAIPTITAVTVKRSPALSELLLPGTLSPLTEASLYARASGYVQHRYVDIGDSVHKGQVLADIESPELDAQVSQATASIAQAIQQRNQAKTSVGDAQAKLDLARATLQRYETMLKDDATSPQDVDVQRQGYRSAVAALASANANVGAAAENVRAARANAQRLVALQDFEKLRAPFDGIITARNVDEGTLISNAGASLTNVDVSTFSSSGGSASAGTTGSTTGSTSSSMGSNSSGAQGTELFRIAQVDRLRVFVTIPQESATSIQLGTSATVFVQEFTDQFRGSVSRTARALDPSARTLLTEVQIDNAQHALMPGMYAQVRFTSNRASPPLLVPGETLITRGNGTMVAVLQPLSEPDRQKLPESPNRNQARRIHLQPVTIGRDYGTEVEITKGLTGQEQLVLSPGDTVQENSVMVPQAPADEASENAPASKGAGGATDRNGKQDKQKGGQKKDGQAQDSAAVRPPRLPSPPAASAPAGAASSPLLGPSDESPSGLQSPSAAAPSQGNAKGKAK